MLMGIGVPEVSDDVDTAVFQLRRLGILRFVDGIFLQGFRHETHGLGLHVGLAEGAQILTGVALVQQIVLDDLISDLGVDGILSQPVLGHLLIGEVGREDRRHITVTQLFFCFFGTQHDGPSCNF